MAHLLGLRAVLVAVPLLSACLGPGIVPATVAQMWPGAPSYLALGVLAEWMRRRAKVRATRFVGGMLLVDGVYLAWVAYITGGTQSPLRFLSYLHVIGVTLLLSYRSGIKIAVWHVLLLLVVFFGQTAGVLAVRDPIAWAAPAEGSFFYRASATNILALCLVTVGTAMFSALNERELRRRNSELRALAEMAEAMETCQDPKEIAELLLATIAQAHGVGRGVVLLSVDGGLDQLAHRDAVVPSSLPLQPDRSMVEAWRTRRFLLLKRPSSEADPGLCSVLPGARNIVLAPLFQEGAPCGVVALEYGSSTSGLRRWTLLMLERFTSHAALALRNAWLLTELQSMAERDPLTGIANRRVFDRTLQREVSRATRSGDQLGLVLLDIDHFKEFNDTYGHQAGDDVLRTVGRVLAGHFRDFDTVARYGGEEFALVLPDCSPEDSVLVAERVRGLVRELPIPSRITLSAGVATLPVHGIDAESLLSAADEALYRSKRSGRDRVSVSRSKTMSVESALVREIGE